MAEISDNGLMEQEAWKQRLRAIERQIASLEVTILDAKKDLSGHAKTITQILCVIVVTLLASAFKP